MKIRSAVTLETALRSLSFCGFLLLAVPLFAGSPEPIAEISPADSFLAPRVLFPVRGAAVSPFTAVEPSLLTNPPMPDLPAETETPPAEDPAKAAVQDEPAANQGQAPSGPLAGFELESAPLAPALTQNAAPADPAGLRRSIDELQAEIASLRTEINKKQDIPDTAKKFSAKAGGMLEWDTVTVDQSRENSAFYGDIDNDFACRDLRLWIKGDGYENLSYEVCLGYTGCLSFKNVMLTAKNLPILGTARLGYFKVESGLNYASNVYDNTFVDWESLDRTFQVGRRLGVASIHYNEDKSLRFFTGAYTGHNLTIGDGKYANENSDNVGLILNTRLTAVPVYVEGTGGELCEVLHLGAGFRWVDPGHDSKTGANRRTSLRAAPVDWLSDMTPLLSGSIDTNSYTVTNIEAAWQKGRFGIIGEGHIGTYNNYDNAYGVSTTARLLLTPGAYQKYSKDGGCFAGIAVPSNMRFIDYENWTCLEGGGVWEIAAQWGWTDLDMLRDTSIPAVYGRMNQYTVALNWYWNPQTRWGINWIHARPMAASGGANEISSALNTLACQVRFTF